MNTILNRMMIAMAALLGVMGLNAGIASAATQHTTASVVVQQTAAPEMSLVTESVPMGYCGPSFSSKAQMIAWYQAHPVQRARAEVWVRMHASYYHIQPDQSFIAWLSMPNVKYKVAPTGYTLQHNTRCDGAGNVIQYDHRLGASKLPMLMWCSDAKGSGSGCVPIAKYYCRNFVIGRKMFPKPTPPAKKPKPKKPVVKTTPGGNCNAIGSPGAIVCSNPIWVNVCGSMQQYNGDQNHLQEWVNTYVADHCAPTVVTTTTCNVAGSMNYGQPGTCIPMPTCQFGGTFPNCSPPPCSVTNTCPPSSFTATGSTSVSSTKTATCPPPNSSIVKTGTASLASPTFTGHGSTQAAADQDLANQEATWRASNQAAVDAQAQNAANGQLSSCPTAPPCQPSVTMTTLNDLDAGGHSDNFKVTVTMCNSPGTMSVSAQFGSVPGGGSVNVSGQNTYTFTYYAPGEVPPGGQDWVTVTVRDSVTGAVATASTPKFTINPPPPSK